MTPAKAAGLSNDTIVVGQSIDLSGPNADLGRDYVAGIKTYFDVLNAKGGINGHRIQYLTRDDQGKPELAVKAVAELIEQNHIDYLFGGVGDEVSQATLTSPVFKNSGLVLYAPLARADYAKEPRILLWRPSYQQEIRYIFTHFSKLGIKNIGVVYQESPATVDAYRSLNAEIKSSGLTLSGTMNLNDNISNSKEKMANEAARLASTKPGFVLVIADTVNTGLFLKEFHKSAPQTFVAGSSLTNLTMLRQLTGYKAIAWTVFSQVVPSPNNSNSVIQLEHMTMMKKYRDEPISALTFEGFSAAKSWALMAQKRIQKNSYSLANTQTFNLPNNGIDIGGYVIGATAGSRHWSNYLDIALFSKSNGLTF